MFSGTTQVCHQVCQFFVSSCACDYGGYKQGCRLLFASPSAIMSEKKKRKRKMRSKKLYLERNISCDAHLLNVLLETDVP